LEKSHFENGIFNVFDSKVVLLPFEANIDESERKKKSPGKLKYSKTCPVWNLV